LEIGWFPNSYLCLIAGMLNTFLTAARKWSDFLSGKGKKFLKFGSKFLNLIGIWSLGLQFWLKLSINDKPSSKFSKMKKFPFKSEQIWLKFCPVLDFKICSHLGDFFSKNEHFGSYFESLD